MRIINQSQTYRLRPSEILNIDCDYLAFCLDEACMYIIGELKNTDEKGNLINNPKWTEDVKEIENTNDNSSLISMLNGL